MPTPRIHQMTFELNSSQRRRLRAVAARIGMTPEELVHAFVVRGVASLERDRIEVLDLPEEYLKEALEA